MTWCQRRDPRLPPLLTAAALLALGATSGCSSEKPEEQATDSGGAPDVGGGPTGGGGPCGVGLAQCGTSCVDLATDELDCGNCAVSCFTGQQCVGGTCQCVAGLTSCGSECVDVGSNAAHCGACNVVCPTGTVCSTGACVASCGAGLTQCGQSCVDTQTNASHCGGCDNACPAGQSCAGGACVCDADETPCNGQCVNLLTDPDNCGACGNACASGSCVSGTCAAPGTGGTGGIGAGGTGGTATGGANTGGIGTGGIGTGGIATGGIATGGIATGGVSTGGIGTGGASTGGATGDCQPCGSHKWACWRMPNPPGTGPNPQSYTESDGIIHDEITCLDWEQSPSSQSYAAAEAIAHCESLTLGGHDDWRAPTRVEMASIVDWTQGSSLGAPFTAVGGFHKTGSNWILTINQQGAGTSCGNGDCAWAFNMSDGIVSNAYSAATAAAIRCVRGNGAGEGYDDPAVAPPAQYTLLSDDEAQDSYTRLIWQRDGDATGLVSWEEAVGYCEGLTLGGFDTWRLPTIRELATLVDEARVAPAINTTVFPNTHYGARSNNWYWASHRARNSSTASWALNFDDGFTGFNSNSAAWNTFGPSYTKCVRDE